jgi:ATP-dependent RNA helicase DDX5/DBP2
MTVDDEVRGHTSLGINGSTDPGADSIRLSHDIFIVTGIDCPKPITSFEETCFPKRILSELTKMGFEKPTPVQMQGWSIAFAGRDLIGIAQTGSGKTLGYILPMIVDILSQEPLRAGDGPIGLVLAPTRELATQIRNETERFATLSDLRVTCCYGGAPKGPQAKELTQGVDICIATPGRLIDFLKSGTTNLKRLTNLVLDEADRMLDMGFGPQLEMILSRTPTQKQSSLWSATFPKEIQQLAYSVCDESRSPVHFSIGRSSEILRPNNSIEFSVDVVDTDHERRMKLFEIIDTLESGDKAIVFTTTKIMCEYVCRELRYESFNALAIHGDKHQTERDWVISQFRNGLIPILIATDVASRGLDIKDVSLVVNYEMPNQMQDFVHRVGRTGRLGGSKKAKAHTFFMASNARFAKSFIRLLNDAGQPVPDKLVHIEQLYSQNQLSLHSRIGILKVGPNLSGSNSIPVSNDRKYPRKRCHSWAAVSTASCSSASSVCRDSPDDLDHADPEQEDTASTNHSKRQYRCILPNKPEI